MSQSITSSTGGTRRKVGGERHRWTVDEYYKMAEMGLFEGGRVELIDGEVLDMSPQDEDHVLSLHRAATALCRCYGPSHWVRVQSPMSFSTDTQPEPDLLVIEGLPRRLDSPPSTGVLVVEVSRSTLRDDRTRKASLYAAAGVPVYWIVNLADRVLEVHTTPIADPASPFGHRYADRRVVSEHDAIDIPVAGVSVQVSALLP